MVDGVVLGAVRALVVLPEFPVAGGVAGAAAGVEGSAFVLVALELFALVSGVRALVVFPELAAAGGAFLSVPLAAVVVSAESAAFALFDFRLLAVLPSAAAGASPVGGVALPEGSAAALFFVLLFFSGAVLAVVSPVVLSALAVSPAAFFDLLLFFLLAVVVPDAAVEASALWSSAAAFFLLVFFLVVVEALSEVAVVSVASAAGFFFFFLVVVVESPCAWSAACAVARPGTPPRIGLDNPANPSSIAITMLK